MCVLGTILFKIRRTAGDGWLGVVDEIPCSKCQQLAWNMSHWDKSRSTSLDVTLRGPSVVSLNQLSVNLITVGVDITLSTSEVMQRWGCCHTAGAHTFRGASKYTTTTKKRTVAIPKTEARNKKASERYFLRNCSPTHSSKHSRACLRSSHVEQLTVGPYLPLPGATVLLWLLKQAVVLHEAIFTRFPPVWGPVTGVSV